MIIKDLCFKIKFIIICFSLSALVIEVVCLAFLTKMQNSGML